VKQQAVSFNFCLSSSLTARVYWPFQFWTWHCEEHLFVCQNYEQGDGRKFIWWVCVWGHVYSSRSFTHVYIINH